MEGFICFTAIAAVSLFIFYDHIRFKPLLAVHLKIHHGQQKWKIRGAKSVIFLGLVGKKQRYSMIDVDTEANNSN